MGRQDTSFRIIRKVSAPEEVKSTQSTNQANVPSTHLKLNAPFKTEDPKNEYPFEIENNYERILKFFVVLYSCPQHEFRCELGLVLRVFFLSSIFLTPSVNDHALFSSYITRWRGFLSFPLLTAVPR